MKRFFLLFTLLALLSGCGKDHPEQPTPTPTPIHPVEKDITISNAQLQYDDIGGIWSTSITSVDNWQLSGDETWCEISQHTGPKGETKIYIMVKANLTAKERTSVFTISCKNQSVNLTIKQAAPTILNTSVHVEEPGTLKKILIEKKLLEAKELKITGVLNEADFATIQSILTLETLDISDINLTSLPPNALKYSLITKIVLPRTLTIIGKDVLGHQLTTVKMFDNVTRIEAEAFSACPLTHINLSSKLTSIEKSTFRVCKLSEVIIPASVEIIKKEAFAYSYKLSFEGSIWQLWFEKNSALTEIGEKAFYNAFTQDGIVYAKNCTQIAKIAPDAFHQNFIKNFYLGTKTPPSHTLIYVEGATSYSTNLYVPKDYVNVYRKNFNGFGHYYISELVD